MNPFCQLCRWSRLAVQKSFASLSAALPSPHGQTAVPPEARISQLLLRRQIRSQAHPTRELQSQSPRPCSRPQTHTQPALCGLWMKQPLKYFMLPSFPFYSVWLCFSHPAYSSTYKCKKCIRKVTEYSSATFTYTEESTSHAGSDE